MRVALIASLFLVFAVSVSYGGTISFDPPLVTAAPGDNVELDVWVSSDSDPASFTSVHVILGSDDLEVTSFAYDVGFIDQTDFQGTPRRLGVFQSDLFVRGFATDPVALPVLVGTLSVSVPETTPGDPDPDMEFTVAGIGLLNLFGRPEFIFGSATIQLGEADDCNNNGTPDSEDIALGVSEDCNFNGFPDECDIASGNSEDEDPADGVPDECALFSGSCTEPGVEDHWTCFDNWNLSGPVYPDDDDSAQGIHVILDPPDDVLLDETVKIPSLVVNAGARLRVSQAGSEGDLSFSSPAQFELRGILHVDGARTIGEPDDTTGKQAPNVTIGAGGRYEKNFLAASPNVSATMHAADLTILGATGFENGGLLRLSDEMSLFVAGSLTLNGGPQAGRSRQVMGDGGRGITPPPKAGLEDISSAHVGGTVLMVGDVIADNSSEVGMFVEGDFLNESQVPSLFDWSQGRLEMNGMEPQTFEVAGLDLGAIFEGFSTDEDALLDTAPHTNFSHGILQIGSDANASDVTLVNEFPNTVGAGACQEALYVDTLVLKAGSLLALENTRVYYRELIEEAGSSVVGNGCGELLQICEVEAPEAELFSAVPKNRYLSFSPSNTGRQTALRVTLSSLPGFEYAEGRTMWVQEPFAVSESAGSTGSAPLPTFWAAELGCTPFYTDWSGYDVVDVFDGAIVPGAIFEVRAIDQLCDEAVAGNFSEPLVGSTSSSGDIVGNCTDHPCDLPEGSVDYVDISAIVDKFRNEPSALRKARTDLFNSKAHEPAPDLKVDFSDVAYSVDAFRNGAIAPVGPPLIDPCP